MVSSDYTNSSLLSLRVQWQQGRQGDKTAWTGGRTACSFCSSYHPVIWHDRGPYNTVFLLPSLLPPPIQAEKNSRNREEIQQGRGQGWRRDRCHVAKSRATNDQIQNRIGGHIVLCFPSYEWTWSVFHHFLFIHSSTGNKEIQY